MTLPHPKGLLGSSQIQALCDNHTIRLDAPLLDRQIQPASLDLRLGAVAYRVRASFLPGHKHKVADLLAARELHRMSLVEGAVLEVGCVYLIPVQESLDLSPSLCAVANPKSSTGRLDVFTRLITDYGTAFDVVPEGYAGPLYLEVSPRTFPVIVRQHSRLAQIRFRYGACKLTDETLATLHAHDPLVVQEAIHIQEGVVLRIDLKPPHEGAPIGYRALRHCGVIDVDQVSAYHWRDFWEPVTTPSSLILDPGQFYILASQESVRIPPTYAAEMVAFDPTVGEFRVHYAGFFDPGFGHRAGNAEGARAVLEVRSHDVPFILEDGQVIGRLLYEPLAERPQSVYGEGLGSHYQGQHLKLSKHFRV